MIKKIAKISAFIAARSGSNRIPLKNLRLIKNKPLFYYLTSQALGSNKIEHLYMNTSSKDIITATKDLFDNKVKIYKRSESLSTSDATLDQYAYDFMQNIKCEYVLFLNPCSLFLTSETIDKAINYFIQNNLDSMVACESIQTHIFKNNSGYNFNIDNLQPRSQDLPTLEIMTSGFFMWKSDSFIRSYNRNGYANFCGKFQTYAIPKIEAIDIDSEEDFMFAKMVMECMEFTKNTTKSHSKHKLSSDDFYPGAWDKLRKGLIQPT
jgi:CMP-N,N'-diacetyllegionaminic acid synthase